MKEVLAAPHRHKELCVTTTVTRICEPACLVRAFWFQASLSAFKGIVNACG